METAIGILQNYGITEEKILCDNRIKINETGNEQKILYQNFISEKTLAILEKRLKVIVTITS